MAQADFFFLLVSLTKVDFKNHCIEVVQSPLLQWRVFDSHAMLKIYILPGTNFEK